MPAAERPARDDERLSTLLFEVNRARARVREGRALRLSPLSRQDQAIRCEQLVGALEAYAAAAASVGVPLSYRYRDEMRLYRAMTQDRTTRRTT